MQAACLPIRKIALRDYAIFPCTGCGACAIPPWACIFDKKDGANEIFNLLLDSSLAVFASPIYFYALPAHFKALIDRSQKFWNNSTNREKKSKLAATALLAAGRAKGEKLFEGSLLCLRLFGRALNLRFQDEQSFRGLESPTDLVAQPQLATTLGAAAKKWAEYLRISHSE